MLIGFVTDVEVKAPEMREVSFGGIITRHVATSNSRITLTIEIENADRATLDAIMGVRIQIQPALKPPDAFAPPAGEIEILTKPVDQRDEPISLSDIW